MIVVLSIAPLKLLQEIVQKNSIKRWLYLGQNYTLTDALEKRLLGEAKKIDYGPQLYSITEELRREFIHWIDEIAYSNSPRKEWLFSVPAVKNSQSSQLFLNLSYFFLYQRFLKEQYSPGLIIVDSPALGFMIRDYGEGDIRFCGWNPVLIGIWWIRNIFKSILRYFKYCLDFFLRLLAARSILKERAVDFLSRQKDIVFIRDFISDALFKGDKDKREEHYFPHLYEYLGQRQLSPVFLSVAVNITNYFIFFRKIRANKKTNVFPEEFLKWPDYLFAILTPWRAMRCRISVPSLNGHDFTSLVIEEYTHNLTEFGVLYAMLLSRLGSRFKRCGFSISGIINWAEFQALEKGLISGLKEADPQIKTIGCQSCILPPNYLCFMPSRQDKLLNVLPDRMLVLGPVAGQMMNDSLEDLKVDYSPPLRYQYIFDDHYNHSDPKHLLILFGYSLLDAKNILRMLLQLREKMPDFDRILLKLHPGSYFNEKRLMQEVGGFLPKKFEFIQGSLRDYLPYVCVGICGATGTAVELVLQSIPVIVMGASQGLTLNYLARTPDPDLWRLCFADSEVLTALRHFKEIKLTRDPILREKALKLRKLYFASGREKYWENFLFDKVSPLRQQEKYCVGMSNGGY